jgi:hypothetical protein
MIRQFGSLWRSNQRAAVVSAGVTLGIALVAGGSLLGWSNLRLRNVTMALQAEQQAVADGALVTEELTALRAELPQREIQSRVLHANGFLEGTDRVRWAEMVAASAHELRPLSYSAAIGTPQWWPLPDAESAWYAAHGLAAPSLHATDLVLRVQGLHEDELKRLLDIALSTGGGITRIEHCQIVRRADDVGVDTECTLRRFGIGDPQAEATPEAGTATENPS